MWCCLSFCFFVKSTVRWCMRRTLTLKKRTGGMLFTFVIILCVWLLCMKLVVRCSVLRFHCHYCFVVKTQNDNKQSVCVCLNLNWFNSCKQLMMLPRWYVSLAVCLAFEAVDRVGYGMYDTKIQPLSFWCDDWSAFEFMKHYGVSLDKHTGGTFCLCALVAVYYLLLD